MLSKLLRSKIFWVSVVAVVLVVGLGGAVTARLADNQAASDALSTFVVQQGPLLISVSTSGTITNRDVEVLKSEVEGQTQILSIVPEGNRVNKGDLLVELDGSSMQDQLVEQQIKLQNAEATLISARENFEVVKNQAESDVDKAELDFDLAKQDLRKYVEGDYPAQLKRAQADNTLAQSDLKRAQEKLKGSERLAEKNFITSIELEADQQAALKAELDLELAEENIKVLTEFTNKRQMAELESTVNQTEMALDRVRRKARAEVVQAEADLKAKEAEFTQQQGKFEKTQNQLAKTKIYAPADGLVVYATSGRGSWRGNDEPLDEGQMVRERQELIHLPKDSSCTADVQVQESSLSKIKPGLPVTITIDALPGKTYHGTVSKIAPLPDAQSMWMNPDLKVYSTEILIDDDSEGLRTGMSCQANIIIDTYQEATYVPVQSVTRVAGAPTVYLARGNKISPREVTLGLDNNRMIRILDGLNPGDQILLNPPLKSSESDAADVAGIAEMESARAAKKAEDSGASSGAAQPEQGGRGDASAGQSAGAETTGDQPQASEARGDEGGRQGRRGNMTDEERKAMRERFEKMTPEEQQKIREQFRQQGGGRGAGTRQGGASTPQ